MHLHFSHGHGIPKVTKGTGFCKSKYMPILAKHTPPPYRYVLKIILYQIDFSTFHGLSLYLMKGCAPTEDDRILIVYQGIKLCFNAMEKE